MSRFIGALTLVLVIACLPGIRASEGNGRVSESPRGYSPVWNRAQDYLFSPENKDNFAEWQERRAAILKNPGALDEALRLHGWGVGTVLSAGGFSFPMFNPPQDWDKSFYIYDGKIFFNQPDGSLTLIDLDTGRVIGRNRNYFIPYAKNENERRPIVRRMWAIEWERLGKILVGGAFIVDAETGAILERSYDAPTISSGKIVYDTYQGDLKHTLYVMDCETKQKNTLRDSVFDIKFTTAGDNVFCISRIPPSGPTLLIGFSLVDGASLWETPLPEKRLFPTLVSQENLIYVFSRLYDEEQCSQIHVYSMQGRLLETVPATPELFGGVMPDRFFLEDFSFKGAQHKGRSLYYRSPSIERNRLWLCADTLKEKYGLTAYPQAASFLPGGGIAWIECDLSDNIPRLHYRDETTAWSGTIRAVDKLMALQAGTGAGTQLFGMAGDGKYIVYASNSGKMECLDRYTGQSRWIYVFSMLYIDNAAGSAQRGDERFTFAAGSKYHQFFTERAAWCDKQLATKGILSFHVDGMDDPKQAVVIVDPSPDTGHRQDVLAAAMGAWGISLALLAALAAICKLRKGRRFKALVCIAVVIFCLVANYFLGGYSWYTFQLLRLDFWVAILLLLLPSVWPAFQDWFVKREQAY